MLDLINEIDKIIREEIDIFNKLYLLEKDKSEAIIQKNGKILESVSSKQEELLNKIEPIECNRTYIIERCRKTYKSDNLTMELILQDIAHINNDLTKSILEKGMKLRKILMSIKSLQEYNRKMIEDNIYYFNVAISKLKNSASLKTEYNENGKGKFEIEDPLLLNQRV